MRRWFIPSWCGDFRFESLDKDACKLIVTDPIPAELTQLGEFLVRARKKGWVDNFMGIAPRGTSELYIGAPVAKAGKVLLGRKAPRKGILTVIKSEGGSLTAIGGDGESLLAAAAAPKATEAVTVRRPTLCCPHATTGPDIRASEVLQAFSTTEQWRSWCNLGYLYCNGNLSGRKYLVAHRHHPISIENKYLVWDCTGDHVIHCWDWSVPPPEEVLMCKLVLEHAEHWIRNLSGTVGALHAKDIYHNPFMPDDKQGHDGLVSTGISRGFAIAMKKLFGGKKEKPFLGVGISTMPRREDGTDGWREDGSWLSDFDYDGTRLPVGIRRRESYR